MRHSNLTPLDELGPQAGCLPFRATDQGCPVSCLDLNSDARCTDAMRLQCLGIAFQEMRSQCYSGLGHAPASASLTLLTTTSGTPIPSDHEGPSALAATQMPIQRELVRQWLTERLLRLLPSLSNQLRTQEFSQEMIERPNVI